jgi:outer membrane protein assembly factor BamD
MPITPARALSALCVLSLTLAVFSGVARADLVWTPASGWKVEGPSVLSGLIPEDGRNALDAMNKARATEESGHHSSAMSSYERIAKKYPNSIYAPEALYRAAKIRLERKQYIKAFNEFEEVVLRYPGTTHFNDIIGEQYRIANALLDGARNHYFGIIPGFRNRSKGVEDFEKILVLAPYSDYAPLALMNIARGHQKLGEPDDAIDALDRMINNYPQSLLAPDAYLRLAQAHASLVEGPYYDQASTKQAITYFEDFMILFPSDPGVGAADKGAADMKKVLAESKIKIGDFYFYKRDNYKAARVFYNEAITSYPDSEVAKTAKARLTEVDAAEDKSKNPAAPRKHTHHFWLF